MRLCPTLNDKNSLQGASGSRAYIASQGPLPTTVMDFWRMIWECEVQVIIMACNEKESGKYKCERYWPSEGDKKQYGNITVELVKWKQVCPDFLLRTLKARCGSEERTLCQFHYWSWPDHGVPTSVGPIVDLVRLVRDCQASEALPVLVHCSAGCGRTGTICAIDYVWGLMRVGKLNDAFSLYQIIREMRMQRIAMVQTKEQYVLVHRVVAALFEQQLRVIDSHTYENLDEDGEPLLGKGPPEGNGDKIYENLDELGLEDGSKEDKEKHEKCDEEKEVTSGGEEPTGVSAAAQENGSNEARDARRSQRDQRSLSWSPEPHSHETSSSILSSSDPRGSSRSSVITDDEDSQSCKDEIPRKSLGKKKNVAEEQSSRFAAALCRTRSLSATNVASLATTTTGERKEGSGKIVGKATVIRRPSIARLKALFEKSDSDDLVGAETTRKRPVFRSYSQRVAPRQPSVAQVPDGAQAAQASATRPWIAKRKSLGPSARKAKEFRGQEKSQRQATEANSRKSTKPAPSSARTKVSVAPVQKEDARTDGNAKEHNVPVSWYGTGSGEVREKNGLYKSFSSSNLVGLGVRTTNGSQVSESVLAVAKSSPSSDTVVKFGQQRDLPPQLPTKKRTAQILYAPVPFRSSEAAKRSQTLPAPPRNSNDVKKEFQPQRSSIYDFLPRKSADEPPRLPPKRTKPTKPLVQPVPISALNNTYVNVSDMLLARNELMLRLGDTRYTNVSLETKENLSQIENTIRQHPRGAIIDLTSRKSFNDPAAPAPKYEQVWDGQPLKCKQTERDPSEAGNASAKRPDTLGEVPESAVENASSKEKSATLPSAFRTHSRDMPQSARQVQQNALSDQDTSDIATTQDERSGTEYDTLFAESSDATETDDPYGKGLAKSANLAGFQTCNQGFNVGSDVGRVPVGFFQAVRRHPSPMVAKTEVKHPLPAYETIYPTQSPPMFVPCYSPEAMAYSKVNPPPKPPRTFDYGNRYDGGRLIVSVVSPKKSQPSESIYQVPPQPRVRPSISRPFQGPSTTSEVVDFTSVPMPTFGTVPFVPLYHPRHAGVQQTQHDYENVYAAHAPAFQFPRDEARPRGAGIVKHHSEYRPPGKAPLRESASGKVSHPTKALQHSFSDAGVYGALRGQQLQPLQQQTSVPAEYAVVVRPKRPCAAQGPQRRFVVAEDNVSTSLRGPAAPPRSRRQAPLESTGGVSPKKPTVPHKPANISVLRGAKGPKPRAPAVPTAEPPTPCQQQQQHESSATEHWTQV
ncbi:protein tyrosine phosphatse n18, putative [Ixodes scapularis]|uniref:protein-tyrosine-phosphatase n=1 Tax=Ixodes scapularis TaxID=6945 RepID=B7P9J3_IXOSC|nr:protein tyrosine phosphatse n18, putative [Ixodes scapularis]|eukprot:XP_002404533.1 protein tyrosine phosphatse n18, putative [Ixodes scapularis]